MRVTGKITEVNITDSRGEVRVDGKQFVLWNEPTGDLTVKQTREGWAVLAKHALERKRFVTLSEVSSAVTNFVLIGDERAIS